MQCFFPSKKHQGKTKSSCGLACCGLFRIFITRWACCGTCKSLVQPQAKNSEDRPSASTADKGREARSVEDRPSAKQYWQHRGPDRALSQASSHCSSAAVEAAQWLQTGHTRGPDHHHDQMSSKLQQAVQAQWAPTGVAQPERRSAQAQLPSGQLSEPDLICQ